MESSILSLSQSVHILWKENQGMGWQKGFLPTYHGKYKTTFSYINPYNGGRGEIRTHGDITATTVFKTVALNHSATLP